MTERFSYVPVIKTKGRGLQTTRGGARTISPLHVAILLSILLLTACSTNPATTPTPPRPTVIVITAAGPYIALFDEPGDWLLGETDASWGRLVDGQYVLTIKKPRQIAWANQTRVFGDGIYEVDARLSSGPEASGFGMLLMGSSDLSAFLYVLITGDGRYDVGYCDTNCASEKSFIGGYKLAPAILVDNQSNHIKVELDSGQLTLIVNGASISALQGLTYGRGVVGLIGESSQYGGFEAAFDNLSVVESHPALPPVSTAASSEMATVTPGEFLTPSPTAQETPLEGGIIEQPTPTVNGTP